jgi:predicted transcriptional regulator
VSAKQTTLEKRDRYVKVWTTEEIKEQLQGMADEQNWTLSFLCHTALREWLEQQEAGDG